MHTPNLIAFQAVDALTEQVSYKDKPIWSPSTFLSSSPNQRTNSYDCDIEHMCNGVTHHPVTGETITNYKKLVAIQSSLKFRETAFGKEFGNQAQGDNRTGEKRHEYSFCRGS